MGILDWLIVGGYLAALGAVGIIATLRVRNTGQYFLGERRFGKLLMVAQSFGVSTHAEMPVSLAGAVYTMGISAIWYQWKNLFAMPFFWIMEHNGPRDIVRQVLRCKVSKIGSRRADGTMKLRLQLLRLRHREVYRSLKSLRVEHNHVGLEASGDASGHAEDSPRELAKINRT